MKVILKYILFLFVFANVSMAQNAFSDAIKLERNREQVLAKLDVILNPEITSLKGIFSASQLRDLENLREFILDPWTKKINGRLNFKVILEIFTIISNIKTSKYKNTLSIAIASLEDEIKKIDQNVDTLRNKILQLQNKLGIINSQKNDKIKDIEQKNIQLQKVSKENISDEEKEQKVKTLIENKKKLEEELEEFTRTELRDSSDLKFQEIEKVNLGNTSLLKKKEQDYKKTLEIELSNNENTLNSFQETVNDSKATFSIFSVKSNTELEGTSGEKPFKISQSTIIEAITIAILEQVSNDINGLLIDNFFNINIKLNDGSSVIIVNELEVLFPRTIKEIKEIKVKRESIINKLNVLKKILFEDINKILENITNDKSYENGSILLRKLKYDNLAEYNYLKFGVGLIAALKNGFHPTDMFSLLINNKDEFGNQFEEYFGYILFIDHLQKNLKNIGSNNMWVNFSAIEELNASDGGQFSSASYFLGFIYQSNPSTFSNLRNVFLIDDRTFNASKFVEFKKDLNNLLVSLNTIEANLKTASTGNSLSIENYLMNIKKIISEVDSTKKIASYVIDNSKLAIFYSQIEKVDKYLNYVITIEKSLHDGNYINILNTVLKIYNVEISAKNISNYSEFIKQFSKYVNFFIDVNNAKSQDELNNAISKAVNKWGGFTAKKERNIILSVNSFVGFSFGKEIINEEVPDKQLINNIAFSIPIGLNLQLLKDAPVFGRISFFFQIFDFTSVANYRLNSDNTFPETVTFKQLFSPGVFACFSSWFLKDFPVSFNFGVNITPELRSLGTDGIPLEKSKSIKYSFNLCYDVPLWHLF